jgi:hypothetical protein
MSVQNNPFGQMWRGALPSVLPDEPETTLPSEQAYLQGFAPYCRTVTANVFTTARPQGQQLVQFYDSVYLPTAFITGTSSLPFGSLDDIFSEIENLAENNEVPPTDFAYLKSREIVGTAYGLMLPKQSLVVLVYNIPKPVVVTDDAGGIRMAWRKGAKTVRTNFGANEHLQSYTYFESDTEHGLRPLNGESLSDRLKWLIKE